jgi:mono/diheme cytochrome c family protein
MKYILIAFFSLLVILLGSSFKQNPKAESIKRGQELYTNNCQSCHMEKGEGVENSYPPLAKSDFLMKDPKKAITIVLKGQDEEITVNGKSYDMYMPAQDYLADDQIADIVNFISNSWGNNYKSLVTPGQVKAARK